MRRFSSPCTAQGTPLQTEMAGVPPTARKRLLRLPGRQFHSLARHPSSLLASCSWRGYRPFSLTTSPVRLVQVSFCAKSAGKASSQDPLTLRSEDPRAGVSARGGDSLQYVLQWGVGVGCRGRGLDSLTAPASPWSHSFLTALFSHPKRILPQ